MIISGHGHLDHHRNGFYAVQPFLPQKRFFSSVLSFLIKFMILVSYAFQLEQNEQNFQGIVSELAKIAGVPISTSWSPNVTHVIASTNMSGSCKRTLKFLMAILNGKWVISMDCKSVLWCYHLLERLSIHYICAEQFALDSLLGCC